MKMRQITKNYLLGISNFLNNIGISLRDLTSITYLPRYILQLIKFYQLGGKVTNIYPIFSDYKKNAGTAGGHYFHQDLLIASYIYKKNPERHVDIGSRIDGFITHLACFRSVEVIDVRKLPPTGHPNITFIQLDLSNPIEIQEATTDSISSLHAIEKIPMNSNDTIRYFKFDIFFMINFLEFCINSCKISSSNSRRESPNRIVHRN
jgi:hypothetical protein